jgi:hypothetical protein
MLINEQQIREYIENVLLETERRQALLRAIIAKNTGIQKAIGKEADDATWAEVPKGTPRTERRAAEDALAAKRDYLNAKVDSAEWNQIRAKKLLSRVKEPWKYAGGKGKLQLAQTRRSAQQARAEEIAAPIRSDPGLLAVKSGAKIDFARRMGKFTDPDRTDYELGAIRRYAKRGGKVNTAGYSTPPRQRDILDRS